ncbi:uncharacterized protein LOC144798821 isoform X2 [Lissotriton helveticus]
MFESEVPLRSYLEVKSDRTTTKLLRRLQRIQNSAARLILDFPRRSHITPHLRDLHWLPSTRGSPSNSSSTHTGPSTTPDQYTSRTDSASTPPPAASALPTSPSPQSHASGKPPSAADPSPSSPPRPGTLSLQTYNRLRTCRSSEDFSRPGSSTSSSSPSQCLETFTDTPK